MRFSRCLHGVMRVGAVMGVLGAVLVSTAWARPKPGKGFRLFASAQLIFQVNRVQCRLFASGQMCATGSSTVGGGIWPKGSADQYIFAGGLQVGGIVDPTQGKDANGFSGDTAGAFFYNTSGSSNGLSLKQILAATDPADVATWPAEALVPCSDPATTVIPGGIPATTIARCTAAGAGTAPEGDLFDPALQGTVSASQGDHWFVYWEGDPGDLASRTHPLGILVETRVLAWNFPTGNEDVMYFLYTFYNITSANPAAYANVRAPLRPFIEQKGKDFVALNTAKYGINLPQDGYTIKDIFVDVVNDMDVANFNANYSGVNVPFALGYTYQNDFNGASATRDFGWTFDPSIFGSAPFFAGVGFAGVKYLLSPIDPSSGQQVGLTLFGTFSNSVGSLTDPNDDKQLYRFMTGHLLGTDGACTLNPDVDKICSVNLDSPVDMRFYQASGPFDLGPGQFGTVAVAYIFAAPVASGNCPGPACNVKAADGGVADRLRIMGNAARMAGGVNQIDRITGFIDFDDVDGNGEVSQTEMTVQPGSLLGKAQVAQFVFDSRFLLPFAPEAPPFFLVPGDNQVTVLWSPSGTETTPDPFFVVASSPTITDSLGNPQVNALYNPNFRALDVEGYRVYRGRTSNPSQLTLLAQYDYAPDPATGKGIFRDFLATVQNGTGGLNVGCAPELGIQTTCPITFSTPAPGQPFTDSVEVDIVGTLTQVLPGGRVALATGESQILPAKLDTAFTDINRGRLGTGVNTQLTNSGVPFLFVDQTARNSVRYFYSVVAFDINSVNSGPSSLESARNTKAVTPTALASNVDNNVVFTPSISGRGTTVTTGPDPSIDAQGRFSGPFQPANGAAVSFVGVFAKQLFQTGGAVTARLIGLGLGDGRGEIPISYTFEAFGSLDTTSFTLFLDGGAPTDGSNDTVSTSSPAFAATQGDLTLAQKFGGNGVPTISAQVDASTTNYQIIVGQGRGCFIDGDVVPASGTTGCAYNGPRWFDGANETAANPNAGMSTSGNGKVPGGNLNNAGAVTGVNTIFVPMSYANFDPGWRVAEATLPGAVRAADFRVYWGNPGKIDSVIDVTHNVAVPFMRDSMGGGFGVLNVSGSNQAGSPDTRPTVVTVNDLGCVEPWKTQPAGEQVQGILPCTSATPFVFSDSAELNTVAIFDSALARGASAPPSANPGFLLYIAGRISMFELSAATLPSQTVWTLRSYTGWVSGGSGAGGDLGPYKFTPTIRPFTALGADLQLVYTVSNRVLATTKNDLSRVHTVPDPYYVRSAFESSTDQKVLKFVNLPQDAIIRIYSASGVLVRILEHHTAAYSNTSVSQGNETQWDLRNRNNQVVASGVYFYHVESGDARRVGRFTVVNFAQ